LSSVRRRELEAAILGAVRRVIAAAILFNHEVAERLGLGASDAQFMTLLELHGSLTPGRLAELSGLRTGTVTGVIDRLERAGFVRRERDPDDRRKVIVSLDAQRIERQVVPHYAARAQRLFAALRRYDDEQIALIADFLHQIAGPPDRAGTPSEAPAGRPPR
jgi:DNA-binding MarR family transcriptional regulator